MHLAVYPLKAIIYAAVVYLMAKEFAVHEFWLVPLSVFVLSAPIFLAELYALTIRQTQRSALFVQKGWLFRLLLGRTLKTVLLILWSLLSVFYMLIQFQFYQLRDWLVFFLVIPVFYGLYLFFRRIFAHEIKLYLVTHMALTWASWCTPVLMSFIYLVLLLCYSDIPVYSSLNRAIIEQKSVVAEISNNALVWNALQFLADFEAVKIYALGQLSFINKPWAIVAYGFANFVIFYNACKMLSCLLIPKHEYLRIVAPLTDADQPDVVAKSDIAVITAVFTFVTLFIYLPLFAYLENVALQSPELQAFRKDIEQKIIRIDNDFYRQELLAELQDAKLKAFDKANFSLAFLDSQVDRAFNRLEANVDNYLDWYYSLGAEYARIGHLMMGNFESYMEQQLQRSLKQGDAFNEVQYALDKALDAHKQAAEEYRQAAKQLLIHNRIEHVVSKVQIIQKFTTNDIFQTFPHDDMLKLQYRLGVTGAAASVGLLGGIVVSKVITKAIGKTTFKLAVKGVSKLAASKAVGTSGGVASGAATGAAIGSVIPGAGTAIGAAVGGIIGGIATGLVIDKALIELESYLNREQFKQTIISAINEARVEFKAGVHGWKSKPEFLLNLKDFH